MASSLAVPSSIICSCKSAMMSLPFFKLSASILALSVASLSSSCCCCVLNISLNLAFSSAVLVASVFRSFINLAYFSFTIATSLALASCICDSSKSLSVLALSSLCLAACLAFSLAFSAAAAALSAAAAASSAAFLSASFWSCIS